MLKNVQKPLPPITADTTARMTTVKTNITANFSGFDRVIKFKIYIHIKI